MKVTNHLNNDQCYSSSFVFLLQSHADFDSGCGTCSMSSKICTGLITRLLHF